VEDLFEKLNYLNTKSDIPAISSQQIHIRSSYVAVHLMKPGGRAQMDGFIIITEAPLVHDDWTQYAKTPVVTTFGQFSLADTNVISYCH
jgi:hypothetical protein